MGTVLSSWIGSNKTGCLVINSEDSGEQYEQAIKRHIVQLALVKSCMLLVHKPAYAILHEEEMLKSKKQQIYSSDRRRASGLVTLTPRIFALYQTNIRLVKG